MARKHRTNRLWVLLAFLVALVTVAVIVILLVRFLESGNVVQAPESNHATGTYRSNILPGTLAVVVGPFANYTAALQNHGSPTFKLLKDSFEFQMDNLFRNSPLRTEPVFGGHSFQEIYGYTELVGARKGSVLVDFVVHLKTIEEISEEAIRLIEATIRLGFGNEGIYGSFGIDLGSIKIFRNGALRPTQFPAVTSSPGQCEPVRLSHCINITAYNFTKFPNLLGMRTQAIAATHASSQEYQEVWTSDCYAYDLEFWCTLWTPPCEAGATIPPCRTFCTDVFDSCSGAYKASYEDLVNCSQFPDSDDPKVCVQNPFQPGKPEVIETAEGCRRLGYNVTSFPNLAGEIAEPIARDMVNMIVGIQAATRCYRFSGLFACAVYLPPYSGNNTVPYHVIPPCRSLCEAYRYNCEFFLEIFDAPLPTSLNCSDLPESDDTGVCLGAKEARTPPTISPCARGNITCDGDRCIPQDWVCDGYQDCRDNSDEKLCASCPVNHVKCPPPSSQCIHKANLCDGKADCYGGLDEHECVRLVGKKRTLKQVEVFNHATDKWEPMCADNWDHNPSRLLCEQLGYRRALSTSYNYSDVFVAAVLNQSFPYRHKDGPTLIQAYLQKGSYCSTGKAVYITCTDAVCGTRPAYVPSPLRVVGGQEVSPGTWPWLVSLHGGPSENFFCGGSIIDEEWILTAAHCVGGKRTKEGWTLKIGHTRRQAYSSYRVVDRADKIFVYPDFSPFTVDHDIALIHLEQPVQFNDFIRPICLPQKDYEPPLGTRCIAAGWGKHAFKSSVYSRAINQVPLDVVNWEYCREAMIHADPKPPHNLTKNMMCAGGSRGHDSCAGDSGGPFVCRLDDSEDRWFAVGVVSWGVLCATPNVPGVYTTLPHYIDWIAEVMANYTGA